MTRNVGLHLGQNIGQVKDIDVGASGNCLGKFLRLRVEIDTSRPLKRVLKLKLDGMEEEKLLLLKYERLPEYCFCCGLLGHAYRECPSMSRKGADLKLKGVSKQQGSCKQTGLGEVYGPAMGAPTDTLVDV
ncbi:hypothetical protein ACOSQ3_019316 [Xanthoceras sorbifolium]